MRTRFLLPLLFFGCGGGSRVTSFGAGDGDAATPSLVGPDASASANGEGPIGHVTMISANDGFVASASFARDGASNGSPRVYGCTIESAASLANTHELDAGIITIDVPTRSGSEAVEVFFDEAEGRYDFATLDAHPEPGAVIHVSALGGEVPAFDAEIRASPNVVFDVPDTLELDARAPKDVPVAWSIDGAGEDVLVELSLGARSVTCWFESHERRGTIPAASIAGIIETAPSSCKPGECMLQLSTGRSKSVASADWTIVLTHVAATIRQVHVTR